MELINGSHDGKTRSRLDDRRGGGGVRQQALLAAAWPPLLLTSADEMFPAKTPEMLDGDEGGERGRASDLFDNSHTWLPAGGAVQLSVPASLTASPSSHPPPPPPLRNTLIMDPQSKNPTCVGAVWLWLRPV